MLGRGFESMFAVLMVLALVGVLALLGVVGWVCWWLFNHIAIV